MRTARIQELETHARALQELSKTRAAAGHRAGDPRARTARAERHAGRSDHRAGDARPRAGRAGRRAGYPDQDLEAHVSALEEQRDAIARERERVVGLNEDLRASTSWRLTSPFRAAGRKVRGIRGSSQPIGLPAVRVDQRHPGCERSFLRSGQWTWYGTIGNRIRYKRCHRARRPWRYRYCRPDAPRTSVQPLLRGRPRALIRSGTTRRGWRS